MSTEYLNKLFHELAPQLHAYASAIGGSPADVDDIVQDTLFRVFTAIRENRIPQTGQFRPFVFAVLRHTAIDHIRRRARLPKSRTTTSRPPVSDYPSPSETAFLKEDAEAIQHAMTGLPVQQHEIIRLRFLEGRSTDEIANSLGISRAAVHNRSHRAMKQLRELLAASSEPTERTPPSASARRPLVTPQESSVDPSTSPPAFVIVWDPEMVSETDYAALVSLLGDLVRAEGGLGIERIHSETIGVPVPEGSLV